MSADSLNYNESFKKNVDDLYLSPDVKPETSSLNLDIPDSNPMQVMQRNTGVYGKNLPYTNPPSNPSVYDYDAQVQASKEELRNWNAGYEDNNEWSKISSYNSGPDGTFYDRYAKFQGKT